MTAAVSVGTCPLPHILRPATPDDMAFVINPWLKELRHAPCSVGIEDAVYYRGQRSRILRLLQRSVTTIACDPEDQNHNYGYVAGERGKLHWCYVKDSYRRVGLGTILIDHARALVQTRGSEKIHCTQSGKLTERGQGGQWQPSATGRWAQRNGLIYNPYVMDESNG